MLGKLIKYDLKANRNVFLLMYAVLLATAVGTRISFIDWINRFDQISMAVSAIGSVLMFTYVIALIAINVICIVLIVRRFYTHLFGGEGYLTFTLPVSMEEHFFSKVISAVIIYVVTFLVQGISLLILCVGIFDPQITQEIVNILGQLFGDVVPMGDMIGQLIINVVATFSSLLMIYFSICVGQMVNRHRVISSVVVYFGLNALLNVINTWISGAFMEIVPSGLSVEFRYDPVYYVFVGVFLAIQLAGFSVGSIMIMKKKLNLE